MSSEIRRTYSEVLTDEVLFVKIDKSKYSYRVYQETDGELKHLGNITKSDYSNELKFLQKENMGLYILELGVIYNFMKDLQNVTDKIEVSESD
ncbi:MAG: hypothetical protein KC589_07865 [Nanoarchaeota archaeon]|nr:hypothetical protein [Nanoarchaeota archaeon]